MLINKHISAQNALSFSLLLFLVFGATIRSAASAIAFFIFIFACIWLYKNIKKKSEPLSVKEKIFLYSIVMLNIVVLLSSYNGSTIDFSAIDALTRFLFAVPVFFMARRIGINISIIVFGGAIGAISMGGYAYYQIMILGYGQATGMTDHNYFGQLSLLLSFISLGGVTYYLDNAKLKQFFFLLSFLIGLFAILASSSRGVWIALPATIFLFFKFAMPATKLYKKVIALFIVISILFSSYAFNFLNVGQRVDSIVNQTVDFFQHDKVYGSADLRLEMWRSSLILIKDDYGLGAGDLGYSKGIKQLVLDKKVHPSMANFTVEPHNYYLKTTVGQGVLGLLFLLMILIMPIRIFYAGLVRSENSSVKTTSLIGVGVIICYMDFMLSNTTLDVQLMSVFMAFILLPLLGNFHYENRGLGNEA